MTEKLYRGMDRDELDRQYNARATVDDIAPYLQRYAEQSAEARSDLEVRPNLKFGPQEDETFDFFPAGSNAPLFVFIHGGYWRLLSKDDSAFFAKNFVHHGVACAAVNYSLAPKASLDEIVRQIRASIAYIWQQADELQIDRNRVFVAGSSAGAHLAAMTLCDGWCESFGMPNHMVAGAMLASGLFDLEPVRLCHPNDWLGLDAAAAMRNSPIRHLPTAGCPILVCWGGTETDEFKRQSHDFANDWKSLGFPCDSFEIGDGNHFDIILDLNDPKRDLCRRTLELIHTGELSSQD
ncbi:MAG: alpha/beta hydrolase [Rhizobiaceae bacterium]